ncbi:MAG: hypothetical protein QW797_06595 [Thermoproteota archaeon]
MKTILETFFPRFAAGSKPLSAGLKKREEPIPARVSLTNKYLSNGAARFRKP